jgi:site-specific DNA-adenine methylase
MKENTIYCGDSGRVLSNTIEFPDESIDLIYLDPPFFSNKTYEVIWGDGYEMRAFEDR